MAAKFIQRQNKALQEIAAKTPHVIPFSGDSPAAKDSRISLASSDGWPAFSYFCSTYFPHIFTKPFGWMHQEMFEEVEALCGVTAITGFRGLGKTVLMGVVYPIWKIIKGERYVIHTAADNDLAVERSAFTLHELQNNRRLVSDFPELEPVDSEKEDFYLKNRTRIRARSIKQSHRGTINPKTARRPGLIVCDAGIPPKKWEDMCITNRVINICTSLMSNLFVLSGEINSYPHVNNYQQI